MSQGFPNPLKVAEFAALLDGIFSILLQIAFAAGTFVIIYGAYLMVSAGGNPDKFYVGKKAVIYSIIGIAMVVLAKAIVKSIATIIP